MMMTRVFLRVTSKIRDIKDSPYSPEIDEIMDNMDEERAATFYDKYVGAKAVLHDLKGDKLMD